MENMGIKMLLSFTAAKKGTNAQFTCLGVSGNSYAYEQFS